MQPQPNHTIKDTVLEKISQQGVTPTSRWYFRAHHAVLWLPGILVTMLGSFAIAGILFSAVHAGWEYRGYVQENLFRFLSQVIPLLWLGSLALFGVLVVRTLRLTPRGYRYRTGAILFLSFVISIVLGAGLFALDTVSTNGNPLIRFQAERAQRILWMMPGEGRLAGVVDTDGTISTLTDTSGKRWILDIREASHKELIVDDHSVRIVGVMLAEDTFLVCAVFPWELTPFAHPTFGDAPMHVRSITPVPNRCDSFMHNDRIPPLDPAPVS